MMKYKNPKLPIEVRVKDLLSRMTLDEKLEQMHCYGCIYSPEQTMEFIKKGENKIHSEFYTYLGFKIKHFNNIQRFLKEKTRLGIPAFISTECVHGAPTPYTTIFPTNGCLAATFDLSLAKKAAHIEGKELKQLGFNRVYSPNVDLLRDGRWGRCGEDYGEDPYLVGKFGAESVKGLQKEGIEATIKHYIAYSMPEGGLNMGTAHLGEREIREYFLPPFVECIEAGAMGVMNCYNEVDGIPAGIDPLWMKKVLRDEIHFNGDVITDYGLGGICFNRHQNVAKSEKLLGKAFLNARIDIEACGRDAYGSHMKEMIQNKEVNIKLIDEAVKRILTNKFKLGLFDEDYTKEIDEFKVMSDEARDLTYEIASKGITLLKNKNVLPLKEGTKILLVGPNASIAQLGGIVFYPFADNGKYANTCAASKAIKTDEAFIKVFGKNNVKVIPCCNFLNVNQKQLDKATELANHWADVIVFAGGNNAQGYSGGENGGMNNPINLPDACTSNEGYDTDDIQISLTQKVVFNALRKCKAKKIFLIYEGKPCTVNEEIDDIDALLYCFGIGMNGNLAVADILKGKVVPSGKLTFTIPRTVGQIPVYYNRKPLRGVYNRSGSLKHGGQDYVYMDKSPLFNFGDGLSYTSFKYSDLKVKKNANKYLVSVKVSNTGKYDADESVLLYTSSLS
ncbi:MAG: glycoside hydrolase family 3 C-terminal domain-containing protein, partial [Bacilli bacterium]|nr:glycoside hydrolase family 3 C-terminal domain-containing protein [Bacilli bacterium]